MPYEKSLQIPFFYADAAGILFFSRVGELFHQVYEKWWQKYDSWNVTFQNPELAIPLVNWQVEFYKPLKAGEKIDFKLAVEAMGESSFSLKCEVYRNKELCFLCHSKHVFIDPKNQKSITIPDKRRSFLKEYQI